MTVELISVGTEILLGNIVNTNAAYLAERCALLGLSCYHQSVVGDNEERLEEELRRALSRSDIVILSGGLGPTKDDLTKEVTAKVFGRELREDPHTRERIQEYFDRSGRKLTANNWKQALVPEGATVVDNHNGTAPGLILEGDVEEGKGRTAILLPGPPNEIRPMFERDIAPYLNRREPEGIYSHMIKICGMGESQVEDQITDLMEQANPTLAPYAKTGEVHLRITARATGEEQAALSVTGIAGPDGGTKEKPVGLVYIGCCVGGNTRTVMCHFTGNRAKNREYAVVNALTILREELLRQDSE